MNTLIDFGVQFMTKWGVPESRARYLSQIVVETEAFRRSTHGIVQFRAINTQLDGAADPRADVTVLHDRGAAAHLDGERCLGGLAVKAAKELAVKKAREYGAGFVTVRNTLWLGALGIHLISVARDGFLAQAWAQTTTCKDCAPYGGIDARFSTNPIAVAFPAGDNPVVGDFSTATMSMSAASALIKSGAKTPTPRFIDNEGRPSNDPAAFEHGGTLMFAGGEVDGHKAYILSLFNEALTVLAGGSANNPDAPQYQSFAVHVLDPAAFAGRQYYDNEMSRYVRYLKSSRVRPGCERVRLPGERGFAALTDSRANGLPLDDDKLQMLKEIAEQHGLEPVA